MKITGRTFLFAAACAAILLAQTTNAAVLFTEDFENGLVRWTGLNNGSHHGITVPDPKASGRGQVLTFTALESIADIFSTNDLLLLGIYTVTFDYLGVPSTNGTVGDLGGYIGISTNFATPVGGDWLGGTHGTVDVALTDDGSWHRYTVRLTNFTTKVLHLGLVDCSCSKGIPGDVFFDNIIVQTVPGNPASDGIATYAGIQITGTIGASYTIQFAPALPSTNWTPLTNLALPSSPYLFFDTTPIAGAGRRFYQTVTNQ